jgi:hypothetical protein
MEWLILGVIGAFFYFIPMVVALARGHPQATAISVLNLLAGWTFIGWVGAIVWACMRIPEERAPTPSHRRYRRS